MGNNRQGYLSFIRIFVELLVVSIWRQRKMMSVNKNTPLKLLTKMMFGKRI